jgi:hypothetical protein
MFTATNHQQPCFDDANPVLRSVDTMIRTILDDHLKGMHKRDLRRGVAMADVYLAGFAPYIEMDVVMSRKLYLHMLAHETLSVMCRNDVQNGLRSMPAPEDILHYGHTMPLEYGEAVLAMPVILDDLDPQPLIVQLQGQGAVRRTPAAVQVNTSYVATRNVHDDMLATSAQQLMQKTVKEFLLAVNDTTLCDWKAFIRRTATRKEPVYTPLLCATCICSVQDEPLHYCTHRIGDHLYQMNQLEPQWPCIKRVLEAIQTSVHVGSTMPPSQYLVMQAVWWVIQIQKDAELRNNLLIAFGEQLASAVEHGHVVCSTGVKTRMISVLQTLNENHQLMSFIDLRHEVLRLASKIRENVLHDGTLVQVEAYNNDTDTCLKDIMINKFKTELIATYQSLCTKLQLDMIDKECGEYF